MFCIPMHELESGLTPLIVQFLQGGMNGLNTVLVEAGIHLWQVQQQV